MNEVDTRTEQLDEGMFEVENATRNLETLTKYHGLEADRLDLWDLRARIHVAEQHLAAAKKLVDQELGKDPHHERRGDLVITVRNEVKDRETYRGGDSTPLRHQVAERIAETLYEAGPDTDARIVDHDAEIELAIGVADGLAKVWSQPAKSKLPSKPALKKLGLDPDEWLTAEAVARLEVKVWPVEQYEAIIGPAPQRPVSEIEMLSEPF